MKRVPFVRPHVRNAICAAWRAVAAAKAANNPTAMAAANAAVIAAWKQMAH